MKQAEVSYNLSEYESQKFNINVTPYGGTKILSATIIRIGVPVDVMW
jgi:hypothetical protein